MQSKYILKLFITGRSQRSQAAIKNLERICHEELGDAYDIVIIDVLEQPDAAEEERILATPTLVKELPPPLRRIIGDLSDKQKVMMSLDLTDYSPA